MLDYLFTALLVSETKISAGKEGNLKTGGFGKYTAATKQLRHENMPAARHIHKEQI